MTIFAAERWYSLSPLGGRPLWGTQQEAAACPPAAARDRNTDSAA